MLSFLSGVFGSQFGISDTTLPKVGPITVEVNEEMGKTVIILVSVACVLFSGKLIFNLHKRRSPPSG